MSSPRSTGPAGTNIPSDPVRDQRSRRDAAIERTRSITRAIGVASVAAVAVFGIYISRAVPGHAATTTGSGTSTVPSGSSGGSAASGSNGSAGNTGNSGGLSAPSSPPAQAQQQSPVVSGSS